MLRKIVFWTHLTCGVAAGLVVLMMSVTGVLLTYERQMLAFAESMHSVEPPPGASRRPLEELLAAVKAHDPAFVPTAVTVQREPEAAVTFAAGRSGTLHVDPFTGAVRAPAAEGLREFFEAVEGWHRWFDATGESRTAARAVTGASNLAFLFLVLSGVYLWLPRMFKWPAFKTRLLLNPKAQSGKARDFNWHHVFGIWSALPLAVVVGTAVVFSYPWANALVFRLAGEEPPQRGGPPRAEAPAREPSGGVTMLAYDTLLERAAAEAGEWRSLTLNLPDAAASTVRFTIDRGNGGQPQRRDTLTLHAATGDVQSFAPFGAQSAGQKARSWIRFLHTGEALGIVGQTVAGLVSLTSVLMVWTGLALAWRRLVVPLYSRKRTPRAA